MEERAKALREKMVFLISKFSKNDVGCGLLISHFECLINVNLPRAARDSSYDFLRGFVWSMYYMGILKKHERSFMVDELIDLSEGR